MAIEVRKPDDTFTIIDKDLPDVRNGDQETTYTVRTLTADKVKALRKPYVQTQFNAKTHRPEELPMTDEDADKFELDLVDYAIKDWTGVLYEGQPLACTREHKALLDATRKLSLLNVAGWNRAGAKVEAARAESFRGPRDLQSVHAG